MARVDARKTDALIAFESGLVTPGEGRPSRA